VTFNDKGKMLVVLGGLESGVGGVLIFDGDGQVTGGIGAD
jgi:hypothetical protein